MKDGKSKGLALVLCFLAYITAAVAGIVFVRQVWWGSDHSLVLIGVADLVATVVIFIFSVVINNSSFYDPYWSVAPIFFVVYYYFFITSETAAAPMRNFLVLVLVTLWGVRLTINFLLHWRGLGHEDWRYQNFRENAKGAYWPVSFLAIHLFPTIIVFIGSLSLYPVFVGAVNGFNAADAAALIIVIGAICIETVSDGQLRKFSLSNEDRSKVFQDGMWGLSRHPNYFGEISFWWGLYLFGLAANPAFWWTVIGPLLITLMFRFISLPLIEKRMADRRRDFKEFQDTVSAIVPWPSRNKS